MQHDSNVQTAEAEISKFPRQLAEDMFNEQVTFEAILHIPTLSFDYSVSDIFEDFIDSMIDSQNADDHSQDSHSDEAPVLYEVKIVHFADGQFQLTQYALGFFGIDTHR